MKDASNKPGSAETSPGGPEQKFALLIVNTEEPFIIVDRSLEIVTFNKKFAEQYARYFGFEVKARTSILNYAQKNNLQDLKKLYEEVLKGQKKEADIQIKFNGDTITFTARYKPALDEHGSIAGCFVTLTDITAKLKAEQMLVANESRFRAFVERTSDGFIAFDQNARYTYVNKKAGEMIRMDPASLIGKYIWDVFPDAIGSATYQAFEKAMKEQVSIVNHDYYAPLNLWQENHFYPSPDGLSLFIRDITKQKRAEEKIKESERNLRTIFENSAEGFILLDTSGVIKLFNAQSNQNDMLDINMEMEVGKSIYDYFKDGKKEYFKNLVAQVLSGETIRYDVDYPTQAGGLVWFHVTLSPVKENNEVKGICITRSDITDRKLHEENIRIAKERYDIVAKATNDAIYDWDLVSDTVVRAGDGLKVLFGYEPEEVNSESDFWKDRVHPDDVGAAYGILSDYLADPGKSICSHEYRFRKANGEYAFVFDKGFIIRDHNKKAIRMIGATQDITQGKQAEMLLKTLNEKLETRAEELAASNTELEQFAYIASHDLQEPLRMITSFLAQLESKYKNKLDDKAQQYIHFATDGAVRMRKIILDLLEYSRVGRRSDDIVTIDTNALLQECVQLNRAVIEEKNAEVEWKDLPAVKGNWPMLQQVFQNLIGNALKYQPANQKPLVKITIEEHAAHWLCAVSDNGIGIDQQFFDKIFVVFQRLHNRNEYSGTGIGLSICKKIIESYQGKIWVDSLPGKGSTFYFTIIK